jgi:hypothetical protein
MAQIINIKDDPRTDLIAILTIKMDDGSTITKKVPKNTIATEEKAVSYLEFLEKEKANPQIPTPSKAANMQFLKGVKS